MFASHFESDFRVVNFKLVKHGPRRSGHHRIHSSTTCPNDAGLALFVLDLDWVGKGGSIPMPQPRDAASQKASLEFRFLIPVAKC
jgi:hypothetical protein